MTQFHITISQGLAFSNIRGVFYSDIFEDMIRQLPDGDYTVSAKKKTQRRSLQASALFHVWIKVFADHIGEVDLERCKTDVKRHILGTKQRMSAITGKMEIEDYKTSEMTTGELSDFMSKFKVWALCVFDCRLPFWKEDGYEQMIELYG